MTDMPADPTPPAPIRRLNLNQLYTLQALLNARTLTEASRMMGLTQPAMSMALRKLRDSFNDDLIIYDGKKSTLSALGAALLARVSHALRVADDTFNTSIVFDPKTTKRTIKITAPESIELLFLSRVSRKMFASAAEIDVEMMPFDYSSVNDMLYKGADIAIVPVEMADPKLSSLPLFDLSIAGIVCSDNKWVGDVLSVSEYLSSDHVALFPDIEKTVLFGSSSSRMLEKRHIKIKTSMYSMLPNLIIGTRFIATLNSWLAQYYAHYLPVRLIKVPFEIPSARLVAQWHPYRENEPVIIWLINQIKNAIDWEI